MKPNPNLIDAENPEWTNEELAQAKWGYEVFSPEQLTSIVQAQAKLNIRLQENLKSQPNQFTKVEIESSIVERFKSSNKDWKKQINDVLRKELTV